MKTILLPLLTTGILWIASGLLNCISSIGNANGGTTTEVTCKISGVLLDSDSKPFCNGSVVLRPNDYLPEFQYSDKNNIQDTTYFRSTVTDKNGRFSFDSVPKDTYIIVSNKDSSLFMQINPVVVDSTLSSQDSLNLGSITLKPPAAIKGIYPLTKEIDEVYVLVLGFDKYVKIDTNGNFFLDKLPEGNITLQFVNKDTANPVKLTIEANAGKTNEIDTLISPLRRILYDGNGYTSGTVPATIWKYENDLVLAAEKGNLTKMWFTFMEWNTRADGSGIVYKAGEKLTIGKAPITLYAQWKPDGMVKIPAKGSIFKMGSDEGEIDEKPVHQVTFTENFWMDTTEVTQGQYQTLMTATYSGYTSPLWSSTYGLGDNYPVYYVTWYDAVLYCNARTKATGSIDTVYKYTSIIGKPGDSCVLEGLTIDLSKKGFRLPTEAQWEYACRAENTTAYYWGDLSTEAGNHAWYSGNSSSTNAVALKQKNGYGLYDMNGNVWEWCNDWDGSYSSDLQNDPVGPSIGEERISRGGSGGSLVTYLRSAYRGADPPVQAREYDGFRVTFPDR